jgi:hypothetical protein
VYYLHYRQVSSSIIDSFIAISVSEHRRAPQAWPCNTSRVSTDSSLAVAQCSASRVEAELTLVLAQRAAHTTVGAISNDQITAVTVWEHVRRHNKCANIYSMNTMIAETWFTAYLTGSTCGSNECNSSHPPAARGIPALEGTFTGMPLVVGLAGKVCACTTPTVANAAAAARLVRELLMLVHRALHKSDLLAQQFAGLVTRGKAPHVRGCCSSKAIAAAKGALMQCYCVVFAYEQQAPCLSDVRAQSGIAQMIMFLTHRRTVK